MFYMSVDWFQQALQTNGKLFSNFEFVLNYRPKTIKYLNEKRGVNIDQIFKLQCVIYQWIWLDKLYKLMEFFFFFQIKKIELTTIINNSGVGFMHARRMRHFAAFVLISTRSS